MIIRTSADVVSAETFIQNNDVISFDTETDGLKVRKNKVVGIGFGNATEGFYLKITPDDRWIALLLLGQLKQKKLITWNAAFDMPITKNNFGIDLLPSLYADVMLLKHTTDEEMPFGLKDCAAKEFGHDVKQEQEAMKASIKANGGTPKEYYKADTDILGRYCIQDCNLTFRLYDLYNRRLEAEGLVDLYYTSEVMPLYRTVTIPMEQYGVQLDMEKLWNTQTDITADLTKLEYEIQASIAPQLDLFTAWLLKKDFPTQTFTGKIPAWKKKYSTPLEAWTALGEKYMFKLQNKFHLKKLFFDTMGLTPLTTTPTGLPQVDEDFLDSIVDKVPWVSKLIEYNKLCKIKSTYIDRFLEEAEDGIFYPTFFQHRTVSGRLAGDFQQLPRLISGDSTVARYTSLIRSFIVARPATILVSADYEQLEPTIFSHVSGDPALQAIFNSGMDFYSEIAIRTEGLNGVSSDKKADNYLGKVDKAARQKAKAYSLGIAYGMTGYKLQFEIGTDQRTADRLVQDYLSAFPGLDNWMQESRSRANTLGQVSTQLGRIRHLSAAKQIYEQYGEAITCDLKLWKVYNGSPLYGPAKQVRKIYKNQLNNAMNFQIQGLAASIVNRAALKLVKSIPDCPLVSQVHDELVFEVPLSRLTEVLPIIKETMENIVELSVPLRTEPQYANSYDKCK